MPEPSIRPDHSRRERVGFDEAIFCETKTAAQIGAILDDAAQRGHSLLLTRLNSTQFQSLSPVRQASMDYEEISRTAHFGAVPALQGPPRVALVTAGSSDLGVSREAVRTLAFCGVACREIYDVGVAGLWRLLERVEELRGFPVVIVAAGMDAALPSVLGGLVPGVVIAVPTSVGYGVAAGGRAALQAALASCAPGVVVVNIDNGYGAACAALRVLNALSLAAITEPAASLPRA
jgi:hypothetical protein